MADQDIELDLETGEEIRPQEPVTEQHDEPNQDDDRTTPVDSDPAGDDDHHQDDEPQGGDLTDDEREAIRARRREERKNRKQAQREREDTLRRELAARDAIINELRTKVEGIERRGTSSELAQLENAKKQAAQEYAYYKDQIRVATEAGNGAAVADATEKLLQSQQKFTQLQSYEQAYKQRQAQPQPLDPRLVNHAQDWMARNKWYDPSGSDQDSRITLTLDQQLAQEGWDPTTPQYWEELSARIKKYLPHKVNRGTTTVAKPKSVVQGSGRESSTRGQNSYRLSAERVQAMKDAGIWDDPKQRAEAVKRFREYDKQTKG